MIVMENVSKEYKNGVHALRDINLAIDDGEFVYIIGPTGSGKSTLIKLLDGEEIPNSGTVMVENINVGKLKHSRVPFTAETSGSYFRTTVCFQGLQFLKISHSLLKSSA